MLSIVPSSQPNATIQPNTDDKTPPMVNTLANATMICLVTRSTTTNARSVPVAMPVRADETNTVCVCIHTHMELSATWNVPFAVPGARRFNASNQASNRLYSTL